MQTIINFASLFSLDTVVFLKCHCIIALLCVHCCLSNTGHSDLFFHLLMHSIKYTLSQNCHICKREGKEQRETIPGILKRTSADVTNRNDSVRIFRMLLVRVTGLQNSTFLVT